MITNDEVKDLQPGDVVELTSDYWPEGTSLRGQLENDSSSGFLCLKSPQAKETYIIRDHDGTAAMAHRRSLKVISHVPRHFYTNSDKAGPESGDVALVDGKLFYRLGGVWFSSNGINLGINYLLRNEGQLLFEKANQFSV